MKYLHECEEVINFAIELNKKDPSDALNRVIEMLQQSEDKTRDHHFKKVA